MNGILYCNETRCTTNTSQYFQLKLTSLMPIDNTSVPHFIQFVNWK